MGQIYPLNNYTRYIEPYSLKNNYKTSKYEYTMNMIRKNFDMTRCPVLKSINTILVKLYQALLCLAHKSRVASKISYSLTVTQLNAEQADGVLTSLVLWGLVL